MLRKGPFHLFPVMILCLCALLVAHPAAALSWSTTVVDDPGDANVGLYSAIALDSTGRAHIAYKDTINNRLKYAYQDAGGTWRRQTVDTAGNPGYGVSIIVDAYDRVHVAYYTSDLAGYGDLRYATRFCIWSFCFWRRETVASDALSSIAAANTSLALDGDGHPNIAFFDHRRGQIRWAEQATDGRWSVGTVATSTGGHVSLALDDLGFPQVGYSDAATGTVRHARVVCYFILCGFNFTTADNGSMGTLRLNGSGQPRLSYWRAGRVRYAQASCIGNDPCTWSSEDVGFSVSRRPTLRLTGSGNPRIAFLAPGGAGVFEVAYASRFFSGWQLETAGFDASGIAQIGLDLNAQGYPQISYEIRSRAALGHARGWFWYPLPGRSPIFTLGP